MSSSPLISIVTPSYNQGRYIEATVRSVLEQDYPCLEYIVMDGGSRDGTPEILRKYDAQIDWVSEKDRGQSDAINKGFRKARGEILGWLNSDDTFCPGALRKVADYFARHPDKGALFGKGYYIDEQGGIIRPFPGDDRAVENLTEACYICQPSMFVKKEVLEKVGYLDESLHFCMDYDLYIRICREFDMGYLGEFLSNCRWYRGSKSSDYLKMLQEVMDVQKKYYGGVSFSQLYLYSLCSLQKDDDEPDLVAEKGGFAQRLKALFLAWARFMRINRTLPFGSFLNWLKINRRISLVRP